MRAKIISKAISAAISAAMLVTSLPASALAAPADSPRAGGDADTGQNLLKLRYDEPVSQGNASGSQGGQGTSSIDNIWQQLTLPIGNSLMGANIYGEIGTEHLTFNQKTLWNGGPSDSRADYNGGNLEGAEGYQNAVNAYLEGNNDEAKAICDQYLRGQAKSGGYGAYQSWGDIYLKYEGLQDNTETTQYERGLDISTALANVDFTTGGVEYHREYFISHPANVLAMKLTTTKQGGMDLNVSFPVDNGESENEIKSNLAAKQAKEKVTYTVNTADKTIVTKGQQQDNQMKLSSMLKVVTEGNVAEGADHESLDISGASEVVIFISADTDYENYYPTYRTGETHEQLAKTVKQTVDAAVQKGYDSVKSEHISDYQSLFNRVTLDFNQMATEKMTDDLLTAYTATGDDAATDAEKRLLEVMLYQYGRYLTIASSREGDLPSNLQGVWQNRVGDFGRIAWGCDYHMNVNLQMNYWPTYSANLSECAKPLIDFINSLREPGRVTAKNYYGIESKPGEANGFTAHTQNNIFGWTAPGWDFYWGWSPAAVPWILQNCWEYYEYTGDKEYMKENLYPMMKEEAMLYDQVLVDSGEKITLPNGEESTRLVSVPAYSPEHGPYTAGNVYENVLIWQLYDDTITAATELGVDEDLVRQWETARDRLAPIEIGDDGQIKEWFFEGKYGKTTTGENIQGFESGHRHMSHMLGLFPGDYVSVENKDLIEAAKVSLAGRGYKNTGWGMGQRINSWARTGDGNTAYRVIQGLFDGGIYKNLWDSHAPFQIDGNFGYTSGVNEMLMQSNMGYINILPALPDVWANGSVDGIVARGNFELGIDWTDKKASEVRILSKNGGKCVVQCEGIGSVTVTSSDTSNNTVSYTLAGGKNNRIEFNTEKGKTYTITGFGNVERPAAPEGGIAVKEGTGVKLTWDASTGATSYNVYSKADRDSFFEKINASDVTGTTYTDTKTYKDPADVWYVVTAVKNGEESERSEKFKVPAAIEVIDDRDTRITYTGAWGNYDAESRNYNGTVKFFTSVDGTESIEMPFTGTGIAMLVNMGSGDAYKKQWKILIDDVEQEGGADCRNLQSGLQKIIFSKYDLNFGRHTFKMSMAGNTGGKMDFDAFVVYGSADAGLTATFDVGEGHTETVNPVKGKCRKDITLPSCSEEGFMGWSDGERTYRAGSSYTFNYSDVEFTAVYPPPVEVIDDRDTRITYTGAWGNYDAESRNYNGTVKFFTSVDGTESIEMPFTGTGIAMLVNMGSGDAYKKQWKILIDGVEQTGGADCRNLQSGFQKIIFSKYDLEMGEHTFKMSMAGNTGGKMDFDAFVVYRGTDAGLTATFDVGEGHTETVNPVKGKCREDITLPSCGEEGFIGWSDGTTTYQAGSSYTFNYSDVEFTAQWEEINTTDPYVSLPHNGWSATAGSSQGETKDGPPEYAIDGNESTYWHSNYSGNNEPVVSDDDTAKNNWFIIDFGKDISVDQFEYVPRVGEMNGNGFIKGYRISYSTSESGEDFQELKKGTWEEDRQKKLVEFDESVTMRRIKIEATSVYGSLSDQKYIHAAEFNVYKQNPNYGKGQKYILPSPRSKWTATASSGAGEGSIAGAIDGNESTYWHSTWNGDHVPIIGQEGQDDAYNEFTIDFGKKVTVDRFVYVPRSNGTNGRILGYALYSSDSETGEFKKIAEGTWKNDATAKVLDFAVPRSMRRLEIRATETEGDTKNKYITAAEFAVYQKNLNYEPPVLTVDSEEIALEPGGTGKINASVNEDNETGNTKVTFASSDPSMVFVYSDGSLKAGLYRYGTAEITVAAAGDAEVKKTVRVTVAPKNEAEITSITLEKTSIQLNAGTSATMVASIKPTFNTDKTITWTSDKENIATVDDGVVTGVSAGDAVITATTKNGLKATCQVKVVVPEGVVRKAGLFQKINAAKKKDLSGFTEATVIVFENAIQSAQAVYDKENATQQEVDDAIAALEAAEKGLASASVDKSALQQKIQAAESKDLTGYTEESVAVFNRVLKAAKDINEKANATQQEVDDAIAALEEAETGLVVETDNFTIRYSANPAAGGSITAKSGDITGANGSIEVASGANVTLRATVAEGYTFIGWYKDNAEVGTDPAYTIENVQANASYVAKFRETGGGDENPDKSALEDAISAFRTKYASQIAKYSNAVKEAFDAAITAAQAIIDKTDATEQEIADAETALGTADTNLTTLINGEKAAGKDTFKTKITGIKTQYAGLVTQYSQAVQTKYNEAITAAETVLNNPEAGKAQIDAASSALDTAIEELDAAIAQEDEGKTVDKTELQTKLNEFKEKYKDLGQYSDAVKENFDKALKAAQDIYDKENATVREVNEALGNLEVADTQLDAQIKQETAAGKPAFKNEINEFIAKYPNIKDYSEAAQKAFNDALKEAEAALNDPEADQAAIENALKKLQEAGSALDQLIENEKPDTVNKTALKSAIDAANKKSLTAYTPASVTKYKAAITRAQLVYNKADATQDDVDKAVKALNDAVKLLVQKANFALLNSAIAAAKKVNLADYSTETANAFKNALTAAQNVAKNLNAMQTQVNAARTRLVNAQNGLKKAVPGRNAKIVQGDFEYKVTKSAAVNGTVAVVKLTSAGKKKGTLKIPATIEENGYIFNVTEIGNNLAAKSKKLKSVEIGANVTKIGSKSFYNCSKLKTVTFKNAKVPKIGKQAFKGIKSKLTVNYSSKMKKKDLKKFQSAMKKAGVKKASYKKKK